MSTSLPLDRVRQDVLAHCERLRDRDGPIGSYRRGVGQRTDLYSSMAVVISRTIMGENLRATLGDQDRLAWIEHINSFAARPHETEPMGDYTDTIGHSPFHGNGQVVGTLGVLGGQQPFRFRYYEEFDQPEKVGSWLDREIDWTIPWSESHKFWGGLHCFSFSKRCTSAWLDACFTWLDANVDPQTGWWRRGVEPRQPYAALGGAVHILPIYEHHGRAFPYPRQMVDSTLAMRQASGLWMPGASEPFTYLELDGLYVLALARQWVPGYREAEIARAVERFADLAIRFYHDFHEETYATHPHVMLAMVGVFGLLQQLCPSRFPDAVAWTDIFSDQRLYQTAAVETEI